MTNDNKTLADVRPGGRVRLGDRPKDGEVLVEVSGLTGSGKSAIAGEIEILCKALGLDAEWVNSDEEKRLIHADWISALEMYKPKVVIVEQNIPRAALSAQPSPASSFDLEAMLAVCVPGGDIADPQVIADNIRHWFAAQPSPGGQDASDYWPEVDRNLVDPYTTGSEGDEFDMIAARNAIRAAIAARQPSKQPDSVALGEATEFCTEKGDRQPVGEPVGYFDPDVLAHLTEGLIDPVGVLRRKPNGKSNVPVWLGPPAQAVDLGELREMLVGWKNSDSPLSYEGQSAQRALDACVADLQGWLDSQAVGNG